MTPGQSFWDAAVVLRTYKFGEADRVVVLLSEENGKLRAVAKGVRKSGSRFGARLEPLSCIRVRLHCGKGELYTISGVEPQMQFPAIRQDLNRLLKSSRMLEIVDSVTADELPHPGLYLLLQQALKTLEAGDSPLFLVGFCWKVLAEEGLAPDADSCSICGSSGPLTSYAVAEGGLRCNEHRGSTSLTAESVEILSEILNGKLRKALARPETPSVDELEHLASRVLEMHSERPLRALVAMRGTLN